MLDKTPYPALTAVDTATQVELARWYRNLRSPGTFEEREILDRIMRRFDGWTPELSKQVGW